MKNWKEEWRKRLDWFRVCAMLRRDFQAAEKYGDAIRALEGT